MRRTILLLGSHAVVLAIGFALGVYFLPILSAPPSPTSEVVHRDASSALFSGIFRRDLDGSDFLHWGEGEVYIHEDHVALLGKLAPGPDYRLYFSPQWVENEKGFLKVKAGSAEAGPVTTFENFMVPVPARIDPREFNTVVVWCESFGEFITAARYR